jgi:gamma-glutamyl hydrolase
MAMRASVVLAFMLLVASVHNINAARPGAEVKTIAFPKAPISSPVNYKNNKPLIGIFTQPCHDCPGKSYVAAGYVKWIEASGGRAVPIRFYASDDELHRLFKSINGLVFAGGLTWLWLDAPYVIQARKMFNWAVAENDKGNPFPIHGTCLGFQLLQILVSNVSRDDLLIDTDSVAHATTLEFSPEAMTSKLFSTMDRDLMSKLSDSTYNLAIQNHMYGVPPEHYERWPIIKKWYNILTWSKDRNGTVYASTLEGKKYPFFGTQWHPEKPPYEFGMEEIPHSLDALRVSQHLSNMFLEQARMSTHKPESHEEELAMLIYSTPAIFSARFEVQDEDNYDGPDITYYFDEKEKPPSGPDDKPDDPDVKPDSLAARKKAHPMSSSMKDIQSGFF